MTLFNAEEYWGSRTHKKYVVEMGNGRGRDQKIVRARDREGAKRTAIENSQLKGKIHIYSCRLATPSDLGIYNHR